MELAHSGEFPPNADTKPGCDREPHHFYSGRRHSNCEVLRHLRGSG